ncbi:MAG: hypothetical protein H7Y20_08750 [Bryobacteraceae bacterium]|nr:hypothetical protein [Bryobacteraceae bacterium]
MIKSMSGMEPGGTTEVVAEECREALRKVIESQNLSGSRRLCQFLAYAGNAAIEGRRDLDQYEIAEKVLGRSGNFNPEEDAAVRKLGTHLRHKLEEYYAGPGTSDEVLVSLPRRSYTPRFHRRDLYVPAAPVTAEPLGAEAEPPETTQTPANLRHSLRWPWLIGGIFVGFVAAMALSRLSPQAHQTDAASEVVIRTTRGDLRGKELDVAQDAVRTGPLLHSNEEVIAKLKFTPEFPTQQAGIMALFNPDQFVRLGQHFKNRSLMEFGFELDGRYDKPLSSFTYDLLGQRGSPRWLSIRRLNDDYRAFLSGDGISWHEYGTSVSLPAKGGTPRAAFYAFNGRSENPPSTAAFDQFGTVLAFHNRPDGPLDLKTLARWQERIECQSATVSEIRDHALQIGFGLHDRGCSWLLTKEVSAGDWAFSTFVDFEPVSGSSVSIVLGGSRRNVELSRRDLDGRSLRLERPEDQDSRIPDFPGCPPVILKMEKRGRAVFASASRDGDHFIRIGEFSVDDVGTLKRIGIAASIAHWTSELSRPPARFYWLKEEPVIPGYLP